MLRKYYPWIIFLGFFLLLVFSASTYAKAIDRMLWPVRFGVLAGFSILVVWSWWRHRRDERARDKGAPRDSVDHFLSSARRWYHGDQKK
jgi:membrane protein implicated in regulation of membrane protease activity